LKNKHIVFAWELGGGLGHIAGFSPLAKFLLKAGYTLSVVSKNVSSTAEVLGHLPIKIYQAPMCRNAVKELDITYTYPEILLDLGYKSPKELSPMVLAWQHILDLLKPDLVIADHSPTALIACKIKHLKVILIGTGFFSPPAISPLPIFAGTQTNNLQRIVGNEQQVLDSINGVLTQLDSDPITQLHELFDVEEDFLCTLPELDHYPEREPCQYWGPRFDIDLGNEVQWSKSDGLKIFAYIKEDAPGFDKLLTALLDSKYNILLYIPLASELTQKRCLAKRNTVLLKSPANIRQVLNESHMIVCHAGHGLVAAALLQGKRLLLVPTQLEQSILVHLLAKRRLVAAVNPRNEQVNYQRAIEFACDNTELGKNIALFKEKYAAFDQQKQLTEMVKRCTAITS
jgi:hypothetical protein